MPIDPRIPLQSFAVQPENPMDLYARFQQLRALGDESKLRSIQTQQAQMQMDEMTRKRDQQNNVRNAYRVAADTAQRGVPTTVPGMNIGGAQFPARTQTVSGPFDQSTMLSELGKTSPELVPGMQHDFNMQALDEQKATIALREGLAKMDKEQLSALAQKIELASRLANSFKQLPPEQKPKMYPSVMAFAAQAGIMQPGMLPDQYTPEIEPWLDMQITQGQTVDQFVKNEMEARKFQETKAQNQATRENWKAERDLQKRGQDITVRGQNMTDARSREQNQIARDTKLEMNRAGETNQLASFTADMDRLAAAANEVKNHPGLAGITGIRGSFPNVPGSQAANAQALLSTLKSQVGFSVLQNMRNNSKTGGALGQVSDRENQMLQDNLAALDKAQSFEAYQKSLQKIIDYTEQAKQRGREAIDRKYGMNQQQSVPAPDPLGIR